MSVLGVLSALASLVVDTCAASHYGLTQSKRNDSTTSVYETRFPNVTWDHASWQLSTTYLDQGHFQSRMTVANGYHGINVAALGPFFEADTPVNGNNINGWPLFDRRQTFATVAGFWTSQPRTNGSNFPWLYQYGWDTAIAGLPHWAGIILDTGNNEVLSASTNASAITNFSSTLDMQNGLMNWNFTWTTTEQQAFDIVYQMFAHKVQINQAFVSLTITPHQDSNLTIANVLNGDCALRTTSFDKGADGDLIYSAVQPMGIDNVTAYVYAGLAYSDAEAIANASSWTAPYVGNNESSIASAIRVVLRKDQSARFIKYVGIASTDAFQQPQSIAKAAALAARDTGYEASLESHAAEWAAIFPRTSVDDFSYPQNGSLPQDPDIVEAAITAVTNPYHILQNTISLNATLAIANASFNSHSVSVGGLGSDSYAGQVFWDAEVWMQPGIVAAFPFAASGISNYRMKLFPQAQENIKTAYQSSKNDTNFSSEAAVFPWTSGRFGNCTATGPCWDYQYHLNGDIVLAMTNQWLASGDQDFLQNSLYPVQQATASLYSQLLSRNGSYWSLTNMTDPDEYANEVDNGGYTMSLVAAHLRNANAMRLMFNQTQNETWAQQADSVLIGRDEDANVVLEYTGPIAMNGSIVVKQADVVLISFPLSNFNLNYTAGDALSDLNYYANKQSPDGPGMTYAIFSIDASEVSPSGCSAYTYQQYSYQPYVRAPWFQFSEQIIDDASVNGGTHPAYPFLTGHGGANQVILFGYLGLRYVADGYLHLDPAPPPQIPYIRYRKFYWQGWPISAFSNQTHTTITRNTEWNPSSGTKPNSTFVNASIPLLVGPVSGSPVLHELPPNGTLTIANRQYWLNQTIPNNIAQCRPVVVTDSDYVPGQFPISAVDGAASTRWQPLYANQTASITVFLPSGREVTGLEFDWGSAPPYNYSVIFHNASDPMSSSALVVAVDHNVSISNAYDPATALEIRQSVGNTTVVTLDQSVAYTPNYATLSIWGSRVNGSLVAENMTGNGATVAEWAIVVKEMV